MIAQFFHVQSLLVVFGAEGDAHGGDHVLDFFIVVDLVLLGFLYVQNLTAQRKNGLEVTIASLLGASAGAVSFHQVQFAVTRIAVGAVGQFAGQAGAGQHIFALHHLPGLASGLTRLSGQDNLRYDLFSFLRMFL